MRSWEEDTFLCEMAACANPRIFAGSGPGLRGGYTRVVLACFGRAIAPCETREHIGLVKAPFTGTVAARGRRVA